MHAELIALLDRERTEVERLKEVVAFLQRQCNEAYRQGRDSIQTESELRNPWQRRAEHYRSRMEYFRGRVTKAIQWFRKQREENIRLQNERDSLRLEVERLKLSQATVIQIDALRALFGPRPASEVYAAQSELELLRVIRKSQGEGITKLRQQLAEACKERDAASVRNEGLRKQLFGVQEDNERVKIELQNAREATNMGAIRYCDVCRERDAWRSEALNLEVRLHACDCIPGVTYCSKCTSTRIVYSNPIEAMKSNPRLAMMLDETRRAYNRNVDNQKAYEAPNCPSS